MAPLVNTLLATGLLVGKVLAYVHEARAATSYDYIVVGAGK